MDERTQSNLNRILGKAQSAGPERAFSLSTFFNYTDNLINLCLQSFSDLGDHNLMESRDKVARLLSLHFDYRKN